MSSNPDWAPVRIIASENNLRVTPPTGTQVLTVPDTVHDRYASFKFIPWWDQARLTEAKVLVVGAGALGNEVLKNLALIGVGHVFIIDFDTIEHGNLGRSVLFRASDVGRPKAEVAAEGVRALNPDTQVQALRADVTTDVGLGVFRRADVIIGCLDNRIARLALNSSAYRLNKPWIDGAIDELLGIARVFWPGRGACYQCTLTPEDWQTINLRYSCTMLAKEQLQEGKVPTTPTTAAIIAAVQTQEALKILHGLPVEAGKAFVFNGLTNYAYSTAYPRQEDCPEHDGGYESIEEVPWATAARTTANELLALARERLGPGAQIELDYELVTGLFCPRCGKTEDILAPLRGLDAERTRCPDCDEPRLGATSHTIIGEESFADRPLAELGVPPLHILSARRHQQYLFLELTGDASSYLLSMKEPE